MINIGIDVGKFKHCASVINGLTGEVGAHEVAQVADKGSQNQQQDNIFVHHQIIEDPAQGPPRVLWFFFLSLISRRHQASPPFRTAAGSFV